MTMKTISVVVPCYCEEEVIAETYLSISSVFRDLTEYNYELVFVDDGSTDNTLFILKKLTSDDPRLRIIKLSRNFGHQVAVSAGLEKCKGAAAVVMDADLQDPPEIIPQMLKLWEEGNDVVYATRNKRHGETFFKRTWANLFYRLLTLLADISIPPNTGDFRLLDRRVIDHLGRCSEQNRVLRGLVSWLGFKQVSIVYDREPRKAGVPKYSFYKSLLLAANAIVAFSKKPLRIALWFGGLSIALAFLLTLHIICQHFTGQTNADGLYTISAIMFMGGVQLFILGTMGEYIGHIYDEVKKRPLYIIDEEIVSNHAGSAETTADKQ